MNRTQSCVKWLLALVVMLAAGGCAQNGKFWGELPENAQPKVAGTKVVNQLLARPIIENRNYGVIYPEVCTSYGSLRFAGAIKDKELVDKLVARYQGMLNPPGVLAPASGPGSGSVDGKQGVRVAEANAANMVPGATHVDRSVFGTLPLEIYRQTKDERYLVIGKKSADDQWANPIEGGLTNQTRWWIDDMFMISAVQSAAHRATGDKIYVDHCATQMAAYLDKLQQPNGLFHHADNVPAFWGRGCGWVAAGLTELLTEMPENHPLRPRIVDGYKKMMAGLLKYQGADGMWKQLLDHEDSWAETSCTGMFTYAMATGVRKGWLPAAEYKEPARKAWIALAGYLNENGQVREVCIGTNKYPQMATNPGGMVAYYEGSRRAVADLHGQAAFIWAAYAMLD